MKTRFGVLILLIMALTFTILIQSVVYCSERSSIEPLDAANAESISDAAAPFFVSVVFYDPVTRIPQNTFHPGDEVGYKVKTVIPASAENSNASLNLNGVLIVSGIQVPFKTTNQLSGQLTNPTGDDLEIFGTKVYRGKFKIPRQAPTCELRMTAQVEIEGFGISTVKKKIIIEQ